MINSNFVINWNIGKAGIITVTLRAYQNIKEEDKR